MILSAAEYAERRGVSPQAVRKAIRDGRLQQSVTFEGRKARIDAEAADAEWRRNTAQSKQRTAEQINTGKAAAAAASSALPPARSGLPSQAQAMAMRTAYQAKLLELDLKQRQGELVNAAEVQRVRFESGRRVRDAILRLGQQMIGDIARAAGGLTPDQRSEVLLVIERHHVKALEALADGNG